MKLNKFLISLGLLALIIGVFIKFYLASVNNFLIHPDSYEYLFYSQNLAKHQTIEFITSNGFYTAPFFYLSRLGYSMLLGGIGNIANNLNFQSIGQIVNLVLFVLNSGILLFYGLKKFSQKKLTIITIWAFFVLSYSNIFWLHLVTSDFLAQTLLLLGFIYVSQQKFSSKTIEILLFISILFTRIELILPLIILTHTFSKIRSQKRLILELFASIILYLLILFILTTNFSRYISYNFQHLKDTINISPALLVGLVIGFLGFLYIKRLKISITYIAYLGFLILGVFFNDIHNMTGTLLNARFQLIHELPNITLACTVFAVYLKTNISPDQKKYRHLIFIFFISLFVYHFYFQHTVIVLPLLTIIAYHFMTKLEPKSFFIILIPIFIIISLYFSFEDFTLKNSDTYGAVFQNTKIKECLDKSKRKIYTTFLLPSLYFENKKDNQITNFVTNQQIDKDDIILIDNGFKSQNNIDISNLNMTIIPESLLIKGTTNYSPIIYTNCKN
jgi:hypothetical protein